jgi:hypothetical protein
MKDKTRKALVKTINTMFPPSDLKYPIAYDMDGTVKVTGEALYQDWYDGECFNSVAIDYYGEYRGGWPWIASALENLAKLHKMHWEWDNAASISLYED